MSMDPSYTYVALLDVLGYRFYLEQDRCSGNLEFQNRLNNALSLFNEINETIFGVQAISDTIIITCSSHDRFPHFLESLRKVFLAFMEQHLFVRGGIAYSLHFQSGRLTYSHALARAHELESKLAIYPRIVIDNNIIRMYEAGDNLPPIQGRDLLCEENGIYFINIITKDNWEYVRKKAKDIYEKNKSGYDEVTLSKHIRFEKYLLQSAHAPSGATSYIDKINSI